MFLFISCLDSSKVADVFKLDSDILNKVEELLNASITALGNWRSLAFRLGISPEIYDDFEKHPKKISPTEEILKWLARAQGHTPIKEIIKALKEIERLDAVEVLCRRNTGEFWGTLMYFFLNINGNLTVGKETTTSENILILNSLYWD